MPDLLLPAAVERENLIAKAELEHARHVEQFNKVLRDIDPRLELVYIDQPPGVTVGPPPGMVWNRWHVQITSPERDVPEFLPITGPNGEFMEPHSGVFEQLRETYTGSSDGQRRFRLRKLEEARQREKAAEAGRAEMREELQLRMKAAFNPSINFGTRGWTARTAGKRGASGAGR
jgi:hypothetical protein